MTIPVGLNDTHTATTERNFLEPVAAGEIARENVKVLKVLALNSASHDARTFKRASTNHVS